MDRWSHLTTEQSNEASESVDVADASAIVALMNREDRTVADAVTAVLPQITTVVEHTSYSLSLGGRLIYVGAGTSGRLGVLDASECPPTFGASPDQVVGLIAGGPLALTNSIEGAEDDAAAGRQAVEDLHVDDRDIVIGLSASGTAPFVIEAMRASRERRARTAAIVCNRDTPLSREVDTPIEVVVGPEVITGSTRLKAGTAQKMVLNMVSTGAMVLQGKVFRNLMVDVVPSNAKLLRRAVRIIAEATGEDEDTAANALRAAGDRPKVAIIMLLCKVDANEAEERLHRAGGFVRTALGSVIEERVKEV